ncbi:exosortase interaction domain-containing protein [Paucilactobacillus hokkaidonensis]|nr:exosortase interaction domain-containing protein [Paucilactobacillus hokkaidonensis]
MMEEEQQRYFYQPNPVSAIISWCWTILILLLGIIVWLEFTHFQWITAALFIVFIVLAFLQIQRRTLLMTPKALVFNRMLQQRYLVIPREMVHQLRFTKRTLQLTVNGQTMYFSFTPSTLAIIKQQLSNN